MKTVGIFDAKTHLSALVEQVERGEEVTITRHGRAVARLKAFRKGRRLGELSAKGLVEEGRW